MVAGMAPPFKRKILVEQKNAKFHPPCLGTRIWGRASAREVLLLEGQVVGAATRKWSSTTDMAAGKMPSGRFRDRGPLRHRLYGSRVDPVFVQDTGTNASQAERAGLCRSLIRSS